MIDWILEIFCVQNDFQDPDRDNTFTFNDPGIQ